MNSRERILAALNGEPADHVPLTTWCFGLTAPEHLRWERDGVERTYWYSLRMEHIHTLPQPWTLDDDFQRALAWREVGIDDVLDVSVPWSRDPDVTYEDSRAAVGELDEQYPVLVREYATPSGLLRHVIRQTESPEPGWVTQPECVPLIEDYNVPRGVEHAVSSADDVPKIRHLYTPPDEAARQWFADRMTRVQAFAQKEGFPVQAWAAFGMDAAVWFTGAEGAVMLSLDAPDAFRELMDIITAADLARVELAAAHPGVDLVVERGWYSSTDFWSPKLFDEFLFGHIEKLARTIHDHGKKFGYVMTTGVDILGERLADAGVDLLYFVDPVQDHVDLSAAKAKLADRMTLVGGTNTLSLQSGDHERIRQEVKEAVELLGPTNRFILHPVDALFPETPWSGIETMIEAWKECR
jgi:uroporphyrinogen-III decarboxylase